jgi:CHAT domain-containing protein
MRRLASSAGARSRELQVREVAADLAQFSMHHVTSTDEPMSSLLAHRASRHRSSNFLRGVMALALVPLALATLVACGGSEDRDRSGSVNPLLTEPDNSVHEPAAKTSADGVAVPVAAPVMPEVLTEEGQQPLISAIAGTYPVIAQLATKEETGEVRAIRAAQSETRLDQARQDLANIKRNLAALSTNGLPTYALIHHVAGDGTLHAWIILPGGGVVAGATTEPYTDLGALPGGLGVDRIAATRGPQLKGTETPRLDAELDADFDDAAVDVDASAESHADAELDVDFVSGDDVDRGAGRRSSPEAIRMRQQVLQDAAARLLPGNVRQVLAAGEGRLLIVPVRDTGTAPYAALPIRDPDDFAARRWSFVVMQDVNVLAADRSAFDVGQVDLARSVIVGDPEDMRDVKYDFPALPGARKEALAVANALGVEPRNVLIGSTATRRNVVRAIDRSAGAGVIYMATHAVADPKNPLTRGFVVLSRNNLFAGELRTTAFAGWSEREPLVVMSACQTALGRVFEGGTFGVARTWTNAGAGQVVASLWNVSDRATYRLMTRFVAGLKQGQLPEAAMQAAQLQTIRNYPDDPKMWASFTIIGKPSIDSRTTEQPDLVAR